MSATVIDRRQTNRERRTDNRAPFVAAVRSVPLLAGRDELALALDLSSSGMRLRRVATPKRHDAPRVRLEFELPDGQGPIVVQGELLFDRTDGTFVASGVRFVELGTEEALRIATYVAQSETLTS
ncbi:MAG: PilZ domain-containing protein [Polyangia bacterium]